MLELVIVEWRMSEIEKHCWKWDTLRTPRMWWILGNLVSMVLCLPPALPVCPGVCSEKVDNLVLTGLLFLSGGVTTGQGEG